MRISRRSFLLTFAAGAAAGCAPDQPAVSSIEGPLYDFHVHLFGVGDGGTGCHLSQQQRQHWNYPFFLRLLHLSENGRMDQDYVAELVRQLRASSIQKCVLLAQDARYNARGQQDLAATNFFVPNEYLFQIVADYPDLFIPCASINPKRSDAMDELAYCAERGARAIKIHPPTQDVDPSDVRFRPFYRRLAELGIVLIVHTGSEHASEVTDPTLTDPARLRTSLEEGCTVIAVTNCLRMENSCCARP